METFYNLPKKVKFCKKCVLSNQRPSSVPEFKHTKNRNGAKYLNIDSKTGICDACTVAEYKKNSIDWIQREKELSILCDKVITHSTSFSIWELSALKKQFYILNLKPEVMKYYFRKIDKDIFIKSIDKIYETIISNKFNEKKLKINWNYLYDECNFYFDGKNKIRYQNSLNEI